jgi:hypothetical protein
MARGGNENRVIFDTRLAKTQHSYGEWPSPAIRGRHMTRWSETSLFDGDSEAPDQPRNFVQLAGIGIRDGLRQPNQAFVIAQRGYVPRNDRRHRPFEIDRDVCHCITCRNRQLRTSSANESFFSARFEAWRIRGPRHRFHRKVQRFAVAPVVVSRSERPISSFARLGGFVIRSALRTLGFAYSSVAQR